MVTSNIDTDHDSRCSSSDKRQWHGLPPTRKNDPRMVDCWSSEMNYQPINVAQKFSLLDAHWQPRVVAEMNDHAAY